MLSIMFWAFSLKGQGPLQVRNWVERHTGIPGILQVCFLLAWCWHLRVWYWHDLKEFHEVFFSDRVSWQQPRLSWNSYLLCKQGWPWTSDPPAFTYWALEPLLCSTTPGLCSPGVKGRTLYMLDKPATSWAILPAQTSSLNRKRSWQRTGVQN